MQQSSRRHSNLTGLAKSAFILLSVVAASSFSSSAHAVEPIGYFAPLPPVVSLTDPNQPAPNFTAYELPNGVYVVEARRAITSLDTPVTGPIARYSTDASASQTVGSTTVEWSNAVAYTISPRQISHYFAKTSRLAGSGDYKAETHATLINGTQYDGPIWFSRDTYPCAQSIVVNGAAQSCQSPFFDASGTAGRNWRVVSGHSFDVGNNGTWDANCSGCIDWVFTFPS